VVLRKVVEVLKSSQICVTIIKLSLIKIHLMLTFYIIRQIDSINK